MSGSASGIAGAWMSAERARPMQARATIVDTALIPKKPSRRQKELLKELADSIEPGQLDTGGETIADRLRRLLLAR